MRNDNFTNFRKVLTPLGWLGMEMGYDVELMAFSSATAVATREMALAVLCLAPGNLHGYTHAHRDMANLHGLLAPATVPSRLTPLRPLAQSHAAATPLVIGMANLMQRPKARMNCPFRMPHSTFRIR